MLIVHNGKRPSRKAGDKAAASKIRAKLQLGEFNFEEEKPTPTIKELADSWINITGPATCKESTVETHTPPCLGTMFFLSRVI